MSSPIHHPKDLDAALMYAPPWAREQGTQQPFRPSSAVARGQRRRSPIALSAYEYSGDRDMAKLQRQLTLDPDRVPKPPTETVQSLLPMLGRLCGVACVAASVAWVIISFPSVHLLRSAAMHVAASAPQSAAAAQKSDPLRTETGAERLIQHGLAVAAPAQPPAGNQPAALAPPPPPGNQQAALAPPPPPLPSQSPWPPQRSVETIPVTAAPPVAAQPNADHVAAENKRAPIDSDEITTLIKRGKQALTDGDLAAARLLLRRAAEGGSADAAFALGTTFDPAVLRQLHAIGVDADVARARGWYEKAAQLGSPAAAEKLAKASQ